MGKMKLPENINELWIIALISVGLPLVALVYFDWRAALLTFVLSQIVLGVLKERYS